MSPSTAATSRGLAPTERTGKTTKTIGYYLAFVVVGLATAALGPTLPDLAENAGAQMSGISVLFTALSLGYLFGSLQGGWLYDRTPGHRVMVAALLIIAAMMALVPLIAWLWFLAAAWLVLGAAAGATDVGGNTLLVWVHGRNVGPYMNALHFFFGVGAFAAPLIVARLMVATGGIAWAYWVLALLSLPALLWLLRLPSPKAEEDNGDEGRRGANPILVVFIALLLFLYVSGEVGFGGWIFSYAVALKLGNETTAAYLTSAFWGALTLGRLLVIPFAARLRPRSILFASLRGCLVSLGVILLWPNSLAVIWLGTLGLGLSMASIFPSAFSLAERHMAITGRVSGWFLMGASLGGMSLPWLIGQLFERIGPHITMWVIMGDIILAVGIFTALDLYLRRSSMDSR